MALARLRLIVVDSSSCDRDSIVVQVLVRTSHFKFTNASMLNGKVEATCGLPLIGILDDESTGRHSVVKTRIAFSPYFCPMIARTDGGIWPPPPTGG